NASRYSQIAKVWWEEGLNMGAGLANPIVCVVLLALCLGVPRERWRQPITIASFAALAGLLLGYIATFVVTPFDLAWHLGGSVGRLYTQVAPSSTFLFVALCRTAEESAIEEKTVRKTRGSAKHSPPPRTARCEPSRSGAAPLT